MKVAVGVITGVISGILVGGFGTAIHRSIFANLPVGVLVAFALTITAGLLIRAAFSFPAFGAYGVGWIVVVQLLSAPNTGGSVIITSPQAEIPYAAAGVIWSYLGAAVLVGLALLPARWFRAPAVDPATQAEAELSAPAESEFPAVPAVISQPPGLLPEPQLAQVELRELELTEKDQQ